MKEVKIIGISVNSQLGILKACQLTFDEENKLIVIKGAVGEGKTTLQKSLQLGTQGTETLTDKSLYGKIDLETELLDGEHKIFVRCKSDKKGALTYTLCKKDNDGNIIENPIIDGVKATPAKYLSLLQTELTWKMDELTSENPTVQKTILLKLFQNELRQIGVVFDKKSDVYKNSILHQIEEAEKNRDYCDMKRKECGGIAEDLKGKGYNVNRPDTLPTYVSLEEIDNEISVIEKEKFTVVNSFNLIKEKKISALKLEALKVDQQCKDYNLEIHKFYNLEMAEYQTEIAKSKKCKDLILNIKSEINEMVKMNFVSEELQSQILNFIQLIKFENEKAIPIIKQKIRFDEQGRVITDDEGLDVKGQELINNLKELRAAYSKISNENQIIDTSISDKIIKDLKEKKEAASEINKIVLAIDSFNNWSEANKKVLELKNKYVQLLASINTGVEGLKIIPNNEATEIYLCYDGSYDPKYFNNESKEFRKLSSYSGTQKPIICLLIQRYLLSKKPKSLRYMFIDNIPIDKKTRSLLENMCNELEIRVFLNMTGDYKSSSLLKGEILIENGEVFFN